MKWKYGNTKETFLIKEIYSGRVFIHTRHHSNPNNYRTVGFYEDLCFLNKFWNETSVLEKNTDEVAMEKVDQFLEKMHKIKAFL